MITDIKKILDEIADKIIGETLTEAQAVEKYGLDMTEDDFLSEMVKRDLELCDGCCTWCRSSDCDFENMTCVFCE